MESLPIVITGGPAAGKTSAIRFFQRELGEAVGTLPESATILYRGGFVRSGLPAVIHAAQDAIFHIQNSLELSYRALFPEKTLLCDRGSLDGATYWPEGADDFFRAMGTTHQKELGRYEAVLFLQTSAAGSFEGARGNACRVENQEEALKLDESLKLLYQVHPRFIYVPHQHNFDQKLKTALSHLRALVKPF